MKIISFCSHIAATAFVIGMIQTAHAGPLDDLVKNIGQSVSNT